MLSQIPLGYASYLWIDSAEADRTPACKTSGTIISEQLWLATYRNFLILKLLLSCYILPSRLIFIAYHAKYQILNAKLLQIWMPLLHDVFRLLLSCYNPLSLFKVLTSHVFWNRKTLQSDKKNGLCPETTKPSYRNNFFPLWLLTRRQRS